MSIKINEENAASFAGFNHERAIEIAKKFPSAAFQIAQDYYDDDFRMEVAKAVPEAAIDIAGFDCGMASKIAKHFPEKILAICSLYMARGESGKYTVRVIAQVVPEKAWVIAQMFPDLAAEIAIWVPKEAVKIAEKVPSRAYEISRNISPEERAEISTLFRMD